MNIKTNSELQKIIADECRATTMDVVATRLDIAPVYVAQIITGARPVSKQVAERMGYKLVVVPKPERLFEPIAR